MSEDLEKYSKKKLEQMYSEINSVTMDELKTDGLTIRCGTKILKLTATEIEDLSMEQEIREELRQKLTEKLFLIKEKLNVKITEMVQYTQRIKIEAERKERELEEKIRNARVMPDVTMDHAKRGLSCVKSQERDGLIWLIQGIYWPKTVDRKPIDPRYSKKLLTNITFKIKTIGNKVVQVSTHQTIGLNHFDHYHQQNPDCWGNWVFNSTYKTPNDIIQIARNAEAVLENVNSRSLANRQPRGLPRFETLQRHVLTNEKSIENNINMLNQTTTRSGITADIRSNDDNVWSL